MAHLPKYVIKKNGNRARFDPEKLRRSILQTFRHAKNEDVHRIGAVLTDLFHELSHEKQDAIDVSAIRKEAVAALNRHKLHGVADAYDLAFLHMKKPRIATVLKRDGRETDFHPYKIWSAVRKSLRDARVEAPNEAEMITAEVVQELDLKHAGAEKPVETKEIRQSVERTLIRHKLPQAAKAYIGHRYF